MTMNAIISNKTENVVKEKKKKRESTFCDDMVGEANGCFVTAYSENLVVRHFEKKNLGGIRQTPLRCSIHTGHVF